MTPILPSALPQEQRSGGFAHGSEGSSTSGSCARAFISDDVNSVHSLAILLPSCSDILDEMKEYPFLPAYPALSCGLGTDERPCMALWVQLCPGAFSTHRWACPVPSGKNKSEEPVFGFGFNWVSCK